MLTYVPVGPYSSSTESTFRQRGWNLKSVEKSMHYWFKLQVPTYPEQKVVVLNVFVKI